MKSSAKQLEQKFVHSVMNGLLVVVAIIWFFALAYIYLSWVILPTFFNNTLQFSVPEPSQITGYLLTGINWFLTTMVLWCLMLAWRGDPGYVQTYFKSVVASEEPIRPGEEPENDLVNHFIKTGETILKKGQSVAEEK